MSEATTEPLDQIDWSAVDRQLILDSMLSGTAYDYAVGLCEVGEHRFAGSPGDQAAVAFLEDSTRQIGLASVRAEPFPFMAWTRGKTELELLGPHALQLEALALAGTSAAHVSGELVDAGYGTEPEFAAQGKSVRGRVVLVRSDAPAWLKRGMYRGEKILRAQTYGASGIVISNAALGLLPLAGSVSFGRQLALPAVSISYEAGEALRHRLRRDGTVHLRLDLECRSWPAVTHNVVADLPGRAWPDQFLVVGAHYDSHDLCVGARDDAGGVGIMLEIARLLAGSSVGAGRSLRFIGFGAEELGLLGAEAYLESHIADLDSHRLMLNLDCAGRPGPKDLCLNHWPTLRPTLERVTRDIADLGSADASPSTHMDHFPFFLRGLPTATLAPRSGNPADPKDAYHHTPADTLDKLTPDDLQAEALRGARALVRLSWASPWPANRRPQAEVEALLETTGIRQSLAAEGRFLFSKSASA